MGGRGTVGGTGKWGVRRGRGRGVALNTDECLNRKGFQTEGPPALGKNVTPLKHKTHGRRTRARTHTHPHLLSDLGGVHQGGVAATLTSRS